MAQSDTSTPVDPSAACQYFSLAPACVNPMRNDFIRILKLYRSTVKVVIYLNTVIFQTEDMIMLVENITQRY